MILNRKMLRSCLKLKYLRSTIGNEVHVLKIPFAKFFHGGWSLLRIIAVISSSFATVLSSMLPLFLYSSISVGYLLLVLFIVSLGALIIHGMLTHLFNDYADFLSGTDSISPAILSGGSRVIQKKWIRPETVWRLGKWLMFVLLFFAMLMIIIGRYELTFLVSVGVWAAYSYSLPPFKLGYRPFLGEWLSLFPSLFFLGLAGPWMIFETVPLWAIQNATINALFCMGWVMVHHIPDVDADKQAVPKKRTTVVWAVDTFGTKFSQLPAFLYVLMTGLCAIWLISTRLWASLFLVIIIMYALVMIMKIEPKNVEQVTNVEKKLLLLAVIIAVVLGVF